MISVVAVSPYAAFRRPLKFLIGQNHLTCFPFGGMLCSKLQFSLYFQCAGLASVFESPEWRCTLKQTLNIIGRRVLN